MVRRRRFGVVLDAARKVQAAGRRPNKIMSEGVIYMYESGSKFPLNLGAHQAIVLEKRRKNLEKNIDHIIPHLCSKGDLGSLPVPESCRLGLRSSELKYGGGGGGGGVG